MSGDGLASVAVAGVGGFVLLRKVLQYRRRVINPDMKDPAPGFRFRWNLVLAAFALAMLALAVAVFGAWDGVGLLASILLLVVTVFVVPFGYVTIWLMAEDRRHSTGYVICEAQYLAAPSKIKATMRRIYRSADSVRAGHAYRSGMLSNAEMDRLVYGAAQRALVSAELASAVGELRMDARREDKEALDAANAKLAEIQDHLIDVEKSLKRSSETAAALSQRLAGPEPSPIAELRSRQRADAQRSRVRATESAQRRNDARARLDDAALRAAAIDPNLDAVAVEDQITAIHQGYEEALTAAKGPIGTRSRSPNRQSRRQRPRPGTPVRLPGPLPPRQRNCPRLRRSGVLRGSRSGTTPGRPHLRRSLTSSQYQGNWGTMWLHYR